MRPSTVPSRPGSSPTTAKAVGASAPGRKSNTSHAGENIAIYDKLYASYRRLATEQTVQRSMRELNRIDTERIPATPR